MRRCADGDAEAWTLFVDGYGRLIRALARRMLTRKRGRAQDDDVDEIVAEVFFALLRRDRLLLRRYDARYRVSTYLGVICRTEVIRHLRRERRRGRELSQPAALPARGPGPDEAGGLVDDERATAIRQLREALATLPERDRLLLTLRFLEGLDYRAIAEATGVSAQSVGPLLHRAKKRLAREVPSLAQMVADDTR